MNCNKCGTRIDKNDNFCKKCGNPLSKNLPNPFKQVQCPSCNKYKTKEYATIKETFLGILYSIVFLIGLGFVLRWSTQNNSPINEIIIGIILIVFAWFMLSNQGNTGEKAYECNFCGYRFKVKI